MSLLPTQRNQLFDEAARVGLPMQKFKWLQENYSEVVGGGEIYNYLIFEGTEFHFKIITPSPNDDFMEITFSPNAKTMKGSEDAYNFPQILIYFNKWISWLHREVSVSNKWNDVKKEVEKSTFTYVADDQYKFSITEYEEIKQRMERLKADVKTLALPQEQVQLIIDKLNHLTDLAKDMNKFDWKGLFVGSIAGIIIQLSIPTSASGMLWEFVKNAFSNFLTP